MTHRLMVESNCNYNASDFRKKKFNNKTKLQQDLGLAVDKKK